MSELVRTKVSVNDLQIGMHVVDLDRPWLETDFLIQGFTIMDDDDIRSLQAQCNFVYIEGVLDIKHHHKKHKKTTNKSIPTASEKVKYIKKVSFEQELAKGKQAYYNAKAQVKAIMEGIRFGRLLSMDTARQTVDGIVDSLLRNSDVLMWLSKIKHKDEYTAEHSLNVCILSATFARHLGHEEEDIRKIALCGLLHDVGKAKIPLEILNKAGQITEQEFEVMKMHPVYGRDLLASLPTPDLSAVDVAFSHHERLDGKGYPRQLSEHQISYFSRVVALADAYDAITSNRIYDKGRASMQALDIIYKNRSKQFDNELALEFIKCIGVYPAGSIVELMNGEVGIVIEEHQSHKLKPRIIIIMNSDKTRCKLRIVDLCANAVDSNNMVYKIRHELPDGSYGIRLNELLNKGLVTHDFHVDAPEEVTPPIARES